LVLYHNLLNHPHFGRNKTLGQTQINFLVQKLSSKKLKPNLIKICLQTV